MSDNKSSLSRFSRTWFRAAWGFVCVAMLPWSALAQPQGEFGFIFMPFQDRSDFKGKWNVGVDVSRYLAAYVKAKYGVPAASPILVLSHLRQLDLEPSAAGDISFWRSLHERIAMKYMILGTVDRFDVSRFMTGEPTLGGYEAFKGEVEVSWRVVDIDRSQVVAVEVGKGTGKGEFADRSLALTLLGKPTDRTVEFRELDKISFGSEEFNKTVIGQACLEAAEDLTHQLENLLPVLRSRGFLGPDSLRLGEEDVDSSDIVLQGRIVRGKIVFLDGESAFIDLGKDDGIRKGQTISVYERTEGSAASSTRKVGEVEVLEVRGPHLSLARIRSGVEVVKRNDAVRVRVID